MNVEAKTDEQIYLTPRNHTYFNLRWDTKRTIAGQSTPNF